MCNTTTVPTVTLQTAILLQVKENAEQGKKFSAHDITAALRNKCNSGQMEIPEVEDLSGQDGHRFDIRHDAVRDLFNEMRDNGVFDSEFAIKKQFNGMFFEYVAQVTSPSPTAPPISVSPTPNSFVAQVASPLRSFVASLCPTPAPVGSSTPFTGEIKQRVREYLRNCTNRNYRPSLKHVQSAIKRGNKSTGVGSDELLNYITTTLNYQVTAGGDIKHTQIITI